MTGAMIGRRDLIKIGGLVTAAGAIGLGQSAVQAASPLPSTVIFDPAHDGARRLAQSNHGAGWTRLALRGDRWQFAQAHLGHPTGTIVGYTGWSDFVFLRGALHERGLRVHAQTRHAGSGASLFSWIAH